MADWYYVQGGQQQGPVSIEALRELAADGRLKANEIVWTEGMPNWQPAGQVSGLMLSVAGPPPLPPMAVGYASPAPYAQAPSLGDDPAARWLLPVGRSGWAIAAGYLGLLSLVVVPAPLALICSIIAIRDIRRHPDRHGMGRAIFGLVMGIVFTAILVFAVAMSAFKSRF
jgi:hypothetical protein